MDRLSASRSWWGLSDQSVGLSALSLELGELLAEGVCDDTHDVRLSRYVGVSAHDSVSPTRAPIG